jgi:hypothetical protein
MKYQQFSSLHLQVGLSSLENLEMFLKLQLKYQTTPKLFKTKNPSKSKLQFSQTLYSYHNFVQMKMFLKVTNTSLNTNQKETNQETS